MLWITSRLEAYYASEFICELLSNAMITTSTEWLVRTHHTHADQTEPNSMRRRRHRTARMTIK